MTKNAERVSPVDDGVQIEKAAEHLPENTSAPSLETVTEHIPEDYIMRHPEVYNPNQAEIHSLSKEVADKVSMKGMLDFVIATCTVDMDDAEHFLTYTIANAYGLKNMPYVVHLDADDMDPENSDKGDGFDAHNNIITLYFGEKAINSFYDHVETLSHELWHARQHQAIDNGEERGHLYKENLNYYIKPQTDKDGYMRQVLEAEAYDIGIRLAMKYMYAQYRYLDADDIAKLRALKTELGVCDISDLNKAFSSDRISKDDYWLLYFDFKLSNPA